MTQLVGKQLGRYKIQQEIGRGGMARVYRGLDTVLQRPVALKVLAPQLSMDPEFARRFNREAVIAANLHHPAIVTIYDIDEYNVGNQVRLHYIAMEFIQGRSLHAILDDRDALGLGYAVSILEPLGRALDYAHSRGAVHRDVKPHNVMLATDGRVLLADFGIAQPPDADTERLTRTGVFMGTPEYISPEQAEARRVDGRSDLYSLGVVAYEIITGRVPFSGATPQLIIAHSQTPPPRPSRIAPHLPPELDAVLMQALAKDPDKRFRNGATLVEALRNVAQHHGIPPASNQQIATLVRPQDSAGQPTISLGKGQTPAASLPIPPQQPAAAPAPAPIPRQRPPAQTANSRPVPPPVQPPIPPSQPPAPPPGTGSAGYPPRSPRQSRFSPNQVAVAVALALLGLALLALFVRGSNSDTGIDVAPTASLPVIETEMTEPVAPTDVPPPATTEVPGTTVAPPTEASSPVPPSPVPPSPVPPSPVPPSPVPPSPVPPTETATPEPPTATLEPPTATVAPPTITPILELPTATAPPEYPPPGTAITNTRPTVAVSTTGTPAGVEATPVPTATAPPQVVATPTATALLPVEPTPTAILQMEPDPTDTDTAEPADLLAGPSATAEGLPSEPSPSPSPLPSATPEAAPSATPEAAPSATATVQPA